MYDHEGHGKVGPWTWMVERKRDTAFSSVLGGVVLFLGGVVLILYGVVIENTLVMSIGAGGVILGLGWASLSGEKYSERAPHVQGGRDARIAREQGPQYVERRRAGHRNRNEAAGLTDDPRGDGPDSVKAPPDQ